MQWRSTGVAAAVCLAVGVVGAPGAQAEETAFPYELKALDIAFVPAAYGTSALGEALEDRQALMDPSALLALDAQDVNAFDRSATRRWSTAWDGASDILGHAHMYVPLLLAAREARRGRWGNVGTFAVMYCEAYLVTKGLTETIQYSVGRTRPFLYNTRLDEATRLELGLDRGAYGSFISGHTAGAFCASVFFARVFAETNPGSRANKWVWGASLAVAAISGYSRYQAGRHYPTDVIGGAIVGGLVGYLVPAFHRSDSAISVAPSGPGGLSLAVRF
jgi:membrane-associated phospholipid phosphatase